MRLRTAVTILLLVFVPVMAHAAKKKKPLSLAVVLASSGMPVVTVAASDEPLPAVARRLESELKVPVDVSAAAQKFRVTLDLDRQPLDLMLRQLAPQAYIDAVLNGGEAANIEVKAIYLRNAGEPAPSLEKMRQRSSDVVMFFGNTEDPAADPFAGKLELTYRNGRLRLFARSQPLAVVASKLTDAVGIPLELIGDPLDLIDASVSDATLEQVMKALTPSVKLYYRLDLATLRMLHVRMVVQASFNPPKPGS